MGSINYNNYPVSAPFPLKGAGERKKNQNMKINLNISIASAFLFLFQFSFAQKKQENMGTEEVNVVKEYKPTISDAFKVKEIPVLNDADNAKKEMIKYSILPFPVATTFSPAKGKAETVEKEEKEHLFKNYATFGGGNYGTLNTALYLNHDLNKTDYLGAILRHHSSQGGIKNLELSDKFFDTGIDLKYGSNKKDLSWNIDLGYQNQIFNWYGLPDNFGIFLRPEYRASLVNQIDSQQSYNTVYLGSKIAINESVFKEISLKFTHFSDAYSSSENRFYAKPSFEFDLIDKLIKTDVSFDYLGGSFQKEYFNTNSISYGFANLGLAPSFALNKNDWTIQIGTGLFYSLDIENKKNKFFIYPQINASYKVVGDLMLFYAGANGNLEQNTYSDFVSENPFLSPTLNIMPTDTRFDIFAGLKGKLTTNVNYTIRTSYLNERNKALFKSNDYSENGTNESYAFGNSMHVVYDNMKTLRFYGELKAAISEQLSLGVNGTFNSYNNSVQKEAWNLPAIKFNASVDYTVSEKWYGGLNVFYVGERKDQQMNNDLVYIMGISSIDLPIGIVTLRSYFDLNAHVGYKYSNRITAFLRANNITNNGYEKWLNFPVQRFQIVLGANYKFDF